MPKQTTIPEMNGTTYHTLTSYDRFQMPRLHLDWQNVPRLTKDYPDFPRIPLQKGHDPIPGPFWSSMKTNGFLPAAPLSLSELSSILRCAYGITARQQMGRQTYLYRSAPSAGALYPVEIYIFNPGLPDLEAGLYYYDVPDFALRKLPVKGSLEPYSPGKRSKTRASSPLSFIMSGIFFRSAWKYRKRAFRYVMLDVGHVIENLLLTLGQVKTYGSVRYDFDDGKLISEMGLDRHREACFALMDIEITSTTKGDAIKSTKHQDQVQAKAIFKACRVSDREVTYEAIEEINTSSANIKREGQQPHDSPLIKFSEPDEWFQIAQGLGQLDQNLDFASVVQNRRSKRHFSPSPIPSGAFMHLLSIVGSNPHFERNPEVYSIFTAVGFLVGRIEGFDPGYYRISNDGQAYGLLKSGEFLNQMAGVCLDQSWLANAGVHFLFIANLKALDDYYGARGYRYVMMNAGRLGQRLYLGSTALNLGCCGIGALYDHEARELLCLSDDAYLLYLVAVGTISYKV